MKKRVICNVGPKKRTISEGDYRKKGRGVGPKREKKRITNRHQEGREQCRVKKVEKGSWKCPFKKKQHNSIGKHSKGNQKGAILETPEKKKKE